VLSILSRTRQQVNYVMRTQSIMYLNSVPTNFTLSGYYYNWEAA